MGDYAEVAQVYRQHSTAVPLGTSDDRCIDEAKGPVSVAPDQVVDTRQILPAAVKGELAVEQICEKGIQYSDGRPPLDEVRHLAERRRGDEQWPALYGDGC